MKKFRMFMFTAAVCLSAAPFLTSCDDITDDSLPTDGSGFAGTYRLNAYAINDEDFANPGTYIPAEADINGDGTASHDLTAESSCYGESYIEFNSNHTYSRFYTYSDGAGGCTTALREAGVWSREGDVITLTSSATNGEPDGIGMETYTQEFTVSGGTITGSREQVDNFVGTGFGSGRVDYTYTKLTVE
jgi:hypothetical protein